MLVLLLLVVALELLLVPRRRQQGHLGWATSPVQLDQQQQGLLQQQ
jgi:hypothetical protein